MSKIRDIANKLLDNKSFYIVVSIIASISIWVFVVGSVNPTREATLTMEIHYTGIGVLENHNLRLSADQPDTIVMRVEASIMDINRLEQNSQIIVDVSGVHEAGEHNVTFTLAAFNQLTGGVSVWPARADQSNTSNTIIVRTNRITGQEFLLDDTGVSYNIDPQGGENYLFVGQRPIIEPEIIRVDGPEEALSRIARIEVYSQFNEALRETTTQTGSLRAFDAEGNMLTDYDLRDISFSQDTVHATIVVQMVKNVPLVPVFIYGAGVNEDNLVFDLSRETVQLIGDPDVLGGISEIALPALRLDQVRMRERIQRNIPTPPSISINDGSSYVEIDIRLVDLEERVMQIPASRVILMGYADDFIAEVVFEQIELTIRGPAEILEELDESDVSILVNLSDYTGTGHFNVEDFTIEIGDFPVDTVGAMDPGRIIISIQRR